jgi:hypothetical protein
MTTHSSISVAASSDWDAKFSLDDYTIRELEFWESNLKQLNSSASGCGAHMSFKWGTNM